MSGAGPTISVPSSIRALSATGVAAGPVLGWGALTLARGPLVGSGPVVGATTAVSLGMTRDSNDGSGVLTGDLVAGSAFGRVEGAERGGELLVAGDPAVDRQARVRGGGSLDADDGALRHGGQEREERSDRHDRRNGDREGALGGGERA